ncbi:MAG: glycosyltransferase, partial [Chloroflexota bacterium]
MSDDSVALVAKPSDPHTGVGRYAQTLRLALERAGASVVEVAPAVPPLPGAGYSAFRRFGVDPRAFLTTYPIWARYPAATLYHLTSQNLASLLLFHPPPGKVVVTVHDIIPYLRRDQPRFRSDRTIADWTFDRLAMAGLRRADLLIAVSHDTRRCLVEHLEIPAARVEVVWQGVDHARFHPESRLAGARERYRLPIGSRFLIYVGSDDPRKDLPTLLRALALVRAERPDVELVKVG